MAALWSITTSLGPALNTSNGCNTKFCHRDFVLKYVVIGGKKGLSGRIGTFLGPILEQIGTFCRYLHQNAELLKIMRKQDNPISRREKVH